MPAAVPARKSSVGSTLCSAARMSTIYQRCGSHGSATWWRTIFVAWRGQSRHQVGGIDGPHVPRGFSRLAHRRGNLLSCLLSSPNSESMDHLARQSGLPNQSSFQLMAAAALYLHNVSLGGKASACCPCVCTASLWTSLRQSSRRTRRRYRRRAVATLFHHPRGPFPERSSLPSTLSFSRGQVVNKHLITPLYARIDMPI